VKQDGTGDFSIIQDAVNYSADGDTVLVYPGIYYENVDVSGKGIVLASTWLLNPQDSLIHQTVIDGDHQGSCIRSTSGESWTSIIGLKLQNGSGTKTAYGKPYVYGFGGGIYIYQSLLIIQNCFITNNFGGYGGGISSRWSSVMLKSNTFTNNWAAHGGGGISTLVSTVLYDSNFLNSVYLNYSSSGADIASYYDESLESIWLDTCTVIDPDRYYIGSFDNRGIHVERPPISVLHSKIEQVNEDLFVSTAGNDENSGLSPDDPLQTISFALLKIASDSLNPKTVHVADGIYSDSLTGDHLPIQLKNHVKLIGESRENTIIDCENKHEGARFAFGQDESLVRNMSFINGNGMPTISNGGISAGFCRKLLLDSLSLINVTGYVTSNLYIDSVDTLIMKNSSIYHSKGYNPVLVFNASGLPVNVEFISNHYNWNYADTAWDKLHTTIRFNGQWVKANMVNCLFHNNSDSILPFYGPVGICVIAYDQCSVQIANCTFADNTTTNQYGGALGVQGGSVDVYNSIFHGNIPDQIGMGYSPAIPGELGVYYSLVEDGHAGITNFGPNNIILWGEGNLDDDPLFFGSGEHPYSIDYGSPCTNAGTLNLPPDITLPEYDIAGNPRIWGKTVDMGAYEYGPWVNVRENPNSEFNPLAGGQNLKFISVSPNPFSHGTYISYEATRKGLLNISVFSISGMKVRTLINSSVSVGDKGSFYWDGTNQEGNDLPAGSYIIRMTVQGELIHTLKIARQ
jgi:hypothetical protein